MAKRAAVKRRAEKQGEDVSRQDELSHEERMANYSEVVGKAELSAVRLIGSTFEVRPSFFETEEERLEFHYEVNPTDIQFDSEEGWGAIFMQCVAGARLENMDLVLCSANYLVAYGGMVDCEREATEAFLRKVGRFTCYPYFRSLFAMLDANAGTSLPTLPVLKEPVAGKKRAAKVPKGEPSS
ncbi:hypothetical protein [Afifella sp. YEN Y35]|uniref:hypothetical protein n=1 Tax=Afifella sp. YEN Y35 TaxID=3388337 RepID=UPI0039E09A3B